MISISQEIYKTTKKAPSSSKAPFLSRFFLFKYQYINCSASVAFFHKFLIGRGGIQQFLMGAGRLNLSGIDHHNLIHMLHRFQSVRNNDNSLSAISWFKLSWIFFSFSTSSAAAISSRITIGASFRNALAIDSL